MKRITALKQAAFQRKRLSGFSVFDNMNMVYLTGFSGASALLLSEKNDGILYVYAVNYEQAKAQVKDLKVELVKQGESLMSKISKQIESDGIRKLGVDNLGISGWRQLSKQVKGKARLVLINTLVQNLRKVKDEKEIGLMKRAGELASEGMRIAYETIRPGIKEYEVAAEIEYAMRRQGSGGTAFETIVASGPSSAFPHGGCSERNIQEGDLVVVDLGATYQMYRSDMTRTIVAGRSSEKQKKLYDIVHRAQTEALAIIKPRVKAKDVDASAMRIISDAGCGQYFVHNFGHGVGLEVHESPILGPGSKDTLAAGNVVTAEPGIYIVGFGGIRIEDTVLVQKDGHKKLTDGPYTLGKE